MKPIKRAQAEHHAAIEQLREAIDAITELESYLEATKLNREDYAYIRSELTKFNRTVN